MMGFFRSKLFKGIIMWVMAIVFAAMFGLVVAGVDPSAMFGGGAPWVLKINGEKVDAIAYQNALRLASDRRQIRFPNDSDPHETASNELINRALILEQARELKTTLDLSGMKRAVSRIPDIGREFAPFQLANDGLYTFWIAKASSSVSSMLSQLPVVSSQEIEQEFHQQNTKAELRYALFADADYTAKIAIPEDEAKAFYDANTDMFWQGEAVKLEFVMLKLSSAPVDVTEEDIADYYERRKSDFATEERRARHILLKDEEDTPEARAATEQKAQELLEQARAEGADFAALAQKHSADKESAVAGGDLGWFDDKKMVPEFTEAAFALAKKGDISEPVRSKFGVHIIQLDARDYRPLEEVQGDIRSAITTTRQAERAREDIQELYFEIDSAGTPNEPLTKERFFSYGAALTTTGFFSRHYDISVIELDPAFRIDEVNKAAFEAPLDVWSEPIQVVNFNRLESYLLIRVLEKRGAGPKPFEEARADIDKILKGQKAREMALAAANALYAKLESGDTLDGLLAKYSPGENDPASIEAMEVQEFAASSSAYIGGIGISREAMTAAFKMNVGDVQGVFESGMGAVVIELKTKTEPNLEEMTDEKRDEIRRQLLAGKQGAAINSWFQDVRNEADIEYNAKALADY